MKTIILSVFLYLFVNSISAQKTNEIIYYNFEPDTCFYAKIHTGGGIEIIDSLRLDINNDFNNEVMFYFKRNSAIVVLPHIETLNEGWQISAIESDSISTYDNTWRSALNWSSAGVPDKIGVRFAHGADYYYGWIRAYVNSNDTAKFIWIDKMAYCTIPNYPLLWGQTEISNSVPKTDAGNDGVKIIFNNASNSVQIESLTKIKEVEIVSSTGQIVNKAKNVGKNETEINASGLQSGVYIVKVSLDDGRVVSGKVVW